MRYPEALAVVVTSVTSAWLARHLGTSADSRDNLLTMGEFIWEAWQNSERKTREYLGLFCFLGVTYAIYLGMHLGVVHGGTDPLAKLCFISALPFAVLTYADSAWRSSDAGPVCVAAWVAASIALSFKCSICVVGLAVTFFPFILSAVLAHGLGAACRFLSDRVHG